MPTADPPEERPGLLKRPQQKRSRITVEAVLEAAFQVLTAHGFDGLTTTRVAERAGVSVGTLYQYVPDKAALVGAVVEAYLAREEEAKRAALAEAESETLGPLVDRLVDAFVGMQAEAPTPRGAGAVGRRNLSAPPPCAAPCNPPPAPLSSPTTSSSARRGGSKCSATRHGCGC
jgi:AcrR family transcriptional regulator